MRVADRGQFSQAAVESFQRAVPEATHQERDMKAKPFKQSTGTAFPEPVTNDLVAEALAKQAAKPPREDAAQGDARDADPSAAAQAAQARYGGGGKI